MSWLLLILIWVLWLNEKTMESSNNKKAIIVWLSMSKSQTYRWWWWQTNTSIRQVKQANWIWFREAEWCDNYYELTHNYGRGTTQGGLAASGNAQDTTAQLTSAWIIMFCVMSLEHVSRVQLSRVDDTVDRHCSRNQFKLQTFWINRSWNDFINILVVLR